MFLFHGRFKNQNLGMKQVAGRGFNAYPTTFLEMFVRKPHSFSRNTSPLFYGVKKIAVSVGIFFLVEISTTFFFSASKPLHPMFLHPTESTLDSPHDGRLKPAIWHPSLPPGSFSAIFSTQPCCKRNFPKTNIFAPKNGGFQ